ncbi:hypothetical protein [Luteolibacter soli]|uniref:Uncharacterized protein n=1 Tax=Luteolibacter soli TaxID=3135280 RepID=A0ABU9AVI1_9BACT
MSLVVEPEGRRGSFWLGALIAPIVILVITLVRVASLASDHRGLSILVILWLGAVEAGIVAFVLSAISWLRFEFRRKTALFTGIPGGLLMVAHIFWLEFVYSKLY